MDELLDEALSVLKDNPEGLIKEKRTSQLASLKLLIPERIRALRKLRRKKFSNFEAAQRECDLRHAQLAEEIKSAKDGSGKLKYHNKPIRDLELLQRVAKDASYQSWLRQRNANYADTKSIDEDLDYLERVDQSLLEIIAMITAEIEYQTRFDKEYGNRSSIRAKHRTRAIAGTNNPATAAPL